MDGRTVAGKITQTGGGVGRNIADALGKLGVDPFLISVVGEEEFGDFVLNKSISHLNCEGVKKLPSTSTGVCMVLCDNAGECLFCVGDMGIHAEIAKDHIRKYEKIIGESSLVVCDGNLNRDAIEFLLSLCQHMDVPVWYEPTDIFRASKPFIKNSSILPAFISPNYQEFLKIYHTIFPNKGNSSTDEESCQLQECVLKGYEMAEIIDNIIITLGMNGVLVIRRGQATDSLFTKSKTPKYIKASGPVSHRLYHPHLVPDEEIKNVSGAGDCFAGGFIAAMLKGKSEMSCTALGLKCAGASLRSSETVPQFF